MATAVTRDLVRELAGFHSRSGCALSMYVDLDPAVAPTIADVDARFRALLAEAEKLADEGARPRACRLALRADVERVRSWREDGLDRDGAHGLALFVSSPDDLFVPLPLPGAVTDGVRLGDELYVTPLIDHVDEDDTLIAVVSRERGQIFRLRGGRLDEIVDETEEQPGRHDQGGWSQARYQRHIEHLVQRHLKTVGTAIDRRVRGAGLQIVVVMPEEMRSAFAARLSHEARSAIIGWVTAEAHARPAELLRAVRPLLEEADAERHEAVMQRFEEALGRGEHAASGWQATVDAAADARVETLLLEEGADRAVWQCPVCRRAGAEDGTCPVDLAPLERRADGADALVHVVLVTGGSVLRVGRGALGGSEVGALLRF